MQAPQSKTVAAQFPCWEVGKLAVYVTWMRVGGSTGDRNNCKGFIT